MKNSTTIKRDTNYSFIKTIKNDSGKEMSFKLEKGSTDYSNACIKFHSKNTSIEIGNEINLNY